MNDRSPWAAPSPHTARSTNTWAAPRLNGAGYPTDFVDRLRAAEPDHPMLKKRPPWPAPTPSRDAIVPGSIVRSRFGSGRKMRVVEAGPLALKYRLVGDDEAGDFTIYPEHAEHARGRKVNAGAKPRPRPPKKRRKAKLKTRIKRKLSPKRYLKRKAKRILKKRILVVPAGTRYNAPKKRLDLGGLRGAKPGQHTKACRAASMVGGRVDHRAKRTPGCPGCNALGPVKGGRR